GGNADDSFSAGGGGGGGGGYGGGGAGDGGAGAGGGSWSIIPTITCNSAPTQDTMPSSPGSSGDDYGSKNGAVEVWIFPNGC
ncbi:pentapeptide repeat-containing protein, partial [Vibrio parahaemolyticus]|nr:pentapeptide repeat-containing protein [Vibrio parahaemolyticus]EJG1879932.1 pentapeptide repeat-containing protein [Vibrio parahaemolyticus]